jgi:hypothetical protein
MPAHPYPPDPVDALPVHWNARLLLDTPFTPTEQAAAKSWATCAIGEALVTYPVLRRIRPRENIVIPADAVLADLGIDFLHHVSADDLPSARITYTQIQIRVQTLLWNAPRPDMDRQ